MKKAKARSATRQASKKFTKKEVATLKRVGDLTKQEIDALERTGKAVSMPEWNKSRRVETQLEFARKVAEQEARRAAEQAALDSEPEYDPMPTTRAEIEEQSAEKRGDRWIVHGNGQTVASRPMSLQEALDYAATMLHAGQAVQVFSATLCDLKIGVTVALAKP